MADARYNSRTPFSANDERLVRGACEPVAKRNRVQGLAIPRAIQLCLCLVPLVLLGPLVPLAADAALLSRLGGQAYYDTVTNLTWVATFSDATANGAVLGRHYYSPHLDWVAALTVAGEGGWRLPSLDVNGDTVISPACAGTPACQDNELGWLYAEHGVTFSTPSPFTLSPVGAAYWTSTPTPGGGIYGFNFTTGALSGLNPGGNLAWAVAVKTGDVGTNPSADQRAQGSAYVDIAITRTSQGASATQIATELETVMLAELNGFVSDPVQAIALVFNQAAFAPVEIAIALRDAFGASLADTTRMLQGAGLSALDIAVALRDAFGTDATLVAQELESRGTNRLETAQALRDAFGIDDVTVAQALFLAGAGPVDIARALRILFGTDPTGTHAILTGPGLGFDATGIVQGLGNGLILNENRPNFLKYAGFHYQDIVDGLVANFTSHKTAYGYVAAEFLAEKNAVDGPVVQFHQNESYLPSSADWYLEHIDRAVLWSSTDPADEAQRNCNACISTVTTLDALPGAVAELKTQGHVAFWLDRTPRYGALGTAKAYVHVLPLEQVNDIQYWFFYPYNGPGTVGCQFGSLFSADEQTAPVGEHVGDWESVTLRYRNDTNELDSVFMSSHGDYHRYPPSQLVFDNGHVVVRPSLNGHANYSPTAEGSQNERKLHLPLPVNPFFTLGTLDVDLLNKINPTGTSWQAWQNVELMAVSGATLEGKEWWDFEGRWGPYFRNALTVDTVENVYFGCVVDMWTGWGDEIASLDPLGTITSLTGLQAFMTPATDFVLDKLLDEDANGPKAPPQKDSASKLEYAYPECPGEDPNGELSDENWEQIGLCLQIIQDQDAPFWGLYCPATILNIIEDLQGRETCEQLLTETGP